ncbi:hypothetical protein [Virgibacillus pantothenticus]|uniref:Uncharacterized protein n=1 Tax=Virgibacillus pantothenticus TaxID=1473 RepID=A0A0L0QW79_VIRPA|nr:hypothetical protein [Virgibacillus pantothenticus]KNE22458.1 hypothetical protein AFK71_02225 [Virgibacillus pantothenticus]MED3738813.1 hypothetical protein [Virgibacillus pantothenticus]QTY16922.1 hypothetical protein KBP50_03090 [Virgibacillus pantothenticus]SIT18240.1 hypothetical protein SAMN05421787_1413 [Virgibacillus pantothenticus]
MDILNTAITIRDSIRDIPKIYKSNLAQIKELEGEELDLLHQIELTRFNARDGYKIAKRIQEIRQERRRLKNENSQLKHLEIIVSKWQDKLPKLDESIGNIRKEKGNITTRKYHCRVRKDLETKINKI